MCHDALVRRAGAFVLVVAGIVLLGWQLDISVLRSVVPGPVAMNPTTALVFALAAGSLLALRTQPAECRPSRRRRAAKLAAAAVTTVGVTTVAGYLLGRNLGLDQILFGGELEGNRIAPNTGFNFVLVGLALLLLDVEAHGRLRPSHVLATASGLIALLAAIGYLYGAVYLYGVGAHFPMALNTAIAFVVLDLGILHARPDRGIMALVTGEGVGAAAARRLLPAAFAIPIAMGWLRLMGQRAGLYGTEVGLTLLVLAIALVFVVIALAFVAQLDRTEHERDLLRTIIDSLPDLIYVKDAESRFLRINRAQAANLGCAKPEDAVGKTDFDFYPEPVARAFFAAERRLYETGEPMINSIERQTVEGEPGQWTTATKIPILDREDRVTGLIGLSRDMTDFKRAEEVLARTMGELEERTRALEGKTREQETFIYSVSHDLRAPLVSLQGLAGILLEDHATDLPGEARRYLDRIIANADKMQALIGDLLEFSRVGYSEIDQVPVDLGGIVRDVVEQLGHTLAARGAAVRVIGELPSVCANRAQLVQLFANLIANAAAYTPADRTPLVHISAVERSDCWEITVRDNGVGIPVAWQEKIFGLFQRLPAGKALNPGGSGVGLAIVARIVETLGGRLWLESAEGVGTAIHFALPMREMCADGESALADPVITTGLVGVAVD